MLVLSRYVGERILIGDDIAITVVRVCQNKVRIGIEAPRTMTVHREEVAARANALTEQSASVAGSAQ